MKVCALMVMILMILSGAKCGPSNPTPSHQPMPEPSLQTGRQPAPSPSR